MPPETVVALYIYRVGRSCPARNPFTTRNPQVLLNSTRTLVHRSDRCDHYRMGHKTPHQSDRWCVIGLMPNLGANRWALAALLNLDHRRVVPRNVLCAICCCVLRLGILPPLHETPIAAAAMGGKMSTLWYVPARPWWRPRDTGRGGWHAGIKVRSSLLIYLVLPAMCDV
jgi:hypothetical protein